MTSHIPRVCFLTQRHAPIWVKLHRLRRVKSVQRGPHDFLMWRVFPLQALGYFPGLLSQRFPPATLHFPQSPTVWGWTSGGGVRALPAQCKHPSRNFVTPGSKASSDVLPEFGSLCAEGLVPRLMAPLGNGGLFRRRVLLSGRKLV